MTPEGRAAGNRTQRSSAAGHRQGTDWAQTGHRQGTDSRTRPGTPGADSTWQAQKEEVGTGRICGVGI